MKILLCVVFLLIAGCSWDGALTTVKTKLLYDEFEAAAVTVLDLPLPEEDRRTVEVAVAELDRIRIELGKIYEINNGQLLLTITQTDAYLNRIRTVYERGREPIERYYDSNDVPVPYHVMIYDRDATEVYAHIKSQLDTHGVNVGEVAELLAVVLRVYAAAGGAQI